MTATALRALEGVVAPFDAARRTALSVLTRSRALTYVVSRPDVRIPWLAAAHVALLLVLTLARPVWLFFVGPVVFGVPHLASDVRYLVLRQRVSRGAAVIAGGAALLLLGLRWFGPGTGFGPWVPELEILVGGVWTAMAIVAGAREARSPRVLVVLLVVVLATAFAWSHASAARLVLAHAHNLLAVALWLAVFRRGKSRRYLIPVAALAVGTFVLSTSAATRWVIRAGGAEGFGVDLHDLATTLAPQTPNRWAAAAVLSFVFWQAVHYAAWLGWIPQEHLPGEGTFTFRMTLRALLRDFGAPPLALVAVLSVVLASVALVDVKLAAGAYMSIASFHGFLEVAMLAYLASRRAGAS